MLPRDPCPDMQTIGILGLGRTGRAVAQWFDQLGKTLRLCDDNPNFSLSGWALKKCEVQLGSCDLNGLDAVIASPGIDVRHPSVLEAQLQGIPLVSELEVASRVLSKPIWAVGGTDGKTTTTLLLQKILHTAGIKTKAVGNIGIPLAEVLEEAEAHWDGVVLEVSAFQLWLTQARTFRPDLMILTNIAEDHLDYFNGDYRYYASVKARPLQWMHEKQWAIFNASDPEIRHWHRKTLASVGYYALEARDLPKGFKAYAYFRDDVLILHWKGREERVLHWAEVPMIGPHNRLNALAAALGARTLEIGVAEIAQALRTFEMPEHRLQSIGRVGRIRWIDDSKATNPHSATAALKAMPHPVILIAGGVDKGLSLDSWIQAMEQKVHKVFLLQSPLDQRLCPALERIQKPFEIQDDLLTLVQQALEEAQKQGIRTILFSPGASSFDRFENYKVRGKAFQKAVQALSSLRT